MHVSEIMQSHPHTINKHASLYEAAKEMATYDIGVLPVRNDDEEITGIITDRDIITRAVARGKDLKSTLVKDVMTSDPLCCKENDDIQEIIIKMNRNNIRRILIIDDNDELVGILSLGDVARHLHDKDLLGEVFSQTSVM